MEPIFKEYFVETRDGIKIYTYAILPDASRTYPVVVQRSPYVDAEKQETADFAKQKTATYASWLESGYAIVVQHCRGTGRSEGDFIPYRNERNDFWNGFASNPFMAASCICLEEATLLPFIFCTWTTTLLM
jgi:predicted acyl esterase